MKWGAGSLPEWLFELYEVEYEGICPEMHQFIAIRMWERDVTTEW
jgi:hypothetical protein